MPYNSSPVFGHGGDGDEDAREISRSCEKDYGTFGEGGGHSSSPRAKEQWAIFALLPSAKEDGGTRAILDLRTLNESVANRPFECL